MNIVMPDFSGGNTFVSKRRTLRFGYADPTYLSFDAFKSLKYLCPKSVWDQKVTVYLLGKPLSMRIAAEPEQGFWQISSEALPTVTIREECGKAQVFTSEHGYTTWAAPSVIRQLNSLLDQEWGVGLPGRQSQTFETPMGPIQIRRPRLEDSWGNKIPEAICELHARIVAEPSQDGPSQYWRDGRAIVLSSPAVVKERASQMRQTYWLLACDKEDSPVGFLNAAFQNPQRIYLNLLYFSADFRGTGLPQQLMKRFLEALKGTSTNEILLDVETRNRRAIRFYESLGFKTKLEHILEIDGQILQLQQMVLPKKLFASAISSCTKSDVQRPSLALTSR